MVSEMNFINIFPTLVVEMIFSNLPMTEVLKSTILSPEVNKIISNSARLMKNFRFKIELGTEPGTRKYCKVDFVEFGARSIFPALVVPLTQLTLYYCYLKDSLLLSKVSDTLELLIIESGRSYKGSGNDDFQLGNLQPLQFPRLKTLILANMFHTNYLFILSIITATNLVEFGINRAWCDDPKKHCFVKLFIDLIKANLKLKIVQFHRGITEMFLADTLEHPEVEYHFEELSFSLYLLPFGDVMNFLELQRNSLKSLRIEYAKIDEDNFERLLSFDLVRLELLCCSIKVPQDAVIQNSSIRSLVIFESSAILDFYHKIR